ncbi:MULTISPECIES: MOSC domain-containing protein [Tistrella]|jgi:MOSC domain-containing protein YiiM
MMMTLPPIDIAIPAIFAGPVRPLGPKAVPSAIDRQPVAGPVWLGPLGIVGDGRGDRRHHGGPEKALHHYAFDHYPWWRQRLDADGPDAPPHLAKLLWHPGAFGENLTSAGLTEADICIGDRFRLGQTVIEVSQGRQPCFRLNLRFGRPDMSRGVQTSHRTGWYYRVIRPGRIAPGDRLVLIARPQPLWPLARVLAVLNGRHPDPAAAMADLPQPEISTTDLKSLAALPQMASSWRDLARKRLASGRIEDQRRRLDGA